MKKVLALIGMLLVFLLIDSAFIQEAFTQNVYEQVRNSQNLKVISIPACAVRITGEIGGIWRITDRRQSYYPNLLPHDKILPYSNRCLNRNLTF